MISWHFAHKCFKTFNHKCSKTLAILISQVKFHQKKLALKLNIEFERVILSMIFTNREKLWNQFYKSILNEKGKNPPILFCYPTQVEKIYRQRLEKIYPILFFILVTLVLQIGKRSTFYFANLV